MAESAKFNPRNANDVTRAYLDSILIEERLLDSVLPDLSVELFGETYSTPIMMPAFSHLKHFVPEQENGMVEYALAAKELNTLNWVGMSENDGFEEIVAVGAKTVRIVKPYEDENKVADQFRFAEKVGAAAIGMDIDHVFGENGQYDCVFGESMAAQTTAMLASYVKESKLPFIVKGVLSVSDAVKCAEAGVKGILVSHHHGRMPFAIPPLMVLPKIAEAVRGSGMKIFVDCGIDTGADAYKALALGADAVAVGRAMMPDLRTKGREGVVEYVRKMNEELTYIMAFTGCKSLKEMDPSVLWINGTPAK